MPPGFEFYEHPVDARIVLRKKPKSKITDDEVSIIDQGMKQPETVKDYLLDRDKESIFVYQTGHTEADIFCAKELCHLIQQYNAKLRFRKTDENNVSSAALLPPEPLLHYGWITLKTSPHLGDLAQKFCYHIDKGSLLEFWIEGKEELVIN